MLNVAFLRNKHGWIDGWIYRQTDRQIDTAYHHAVAALRSDE